MGGRQLADTLLSTATPVTGEHQPCYIVLYRVPDDDEEPALFIAYTASHDPLKPTAEEIDAIVRSFDEPDPEYFRAMVVAALAAPEFLSQAEYDGLFGQGIVNAGKAVQGPGYFNASRLIPPEALSRGEFGGHYALYRIDTRGHSALWSNDIGQRTARDGELEGLDVGLHKTGDGLLWLTGNNTWLGPTVAAGGGIALGKTGQGDRPAVAGDVYVLDGAWFTGNGSVRGDLHSAGLLIPGLKDDSGSRLSVQGRVDSRGTTFFYLGPDGQSTGLDASAIALGRLELGTPDGSPFRPWLDYHNLATATENLSVSQGERIVISPFLSFRPHVSENVLGLISETRALNTLPEMPPLLTGMAGALERLYRVYENQATQRQLDFLYNLSLPGFVDTAVSLRGDIHAATLTAQPFRDSVLLSAVAGKIPDPGLSQAGNGSGRLWLRPLAGYAHFSADSHTRLESTTLHSRGVIMGWEPASESQPMGLLFATGRSDLRQGAGKATISDTRGALYFRQSKDAVSMSGLASLGWQQYSTQRQLSIPGGGSAESDFTGYTLGSGLGIEWDLLYGKESAFSLSPGVLLDVELVHQNSRQERSRTPFGLTISSKENIRSAVTPGLDVSYVPDVGTRASLYAGYRQRLSGHRPAMDVRFMSVPDNHFRAQGQPESRGASVWRGQVEQSLTKNIKAGLFWESEYARTGQSHSGGIMLEVVW